MEEEKWLKILEGTGTIALGARFLGEMESWIMQVSSSDMPYLQYRTRLTLCQDSHLNYRILI